MWPVILGYAETSRLLVAWCELHQGFRHFRTDRMIEAETLDEAVGLRPGELRRRWRRWREANARFSWLDTALAAGRSLGLRL